MKATIWTLAALTGAALMLAGGNAQPPAPRDDAPPSDLPGDEPKIVKPLKPLPLPGSFRKKESVEQPKSKGEEDSVPVVAPRGSNAGPLDDEVAPPSRVVRPVDPTGDELTTTPEFRPAAKSKSAAVVKGDDEDDEPIPGTASVRRARTTRKTTSIMDPPAAAGDASRKVDQALTLEWACPTNIKAKHPFTCEMIVRNNGAQPAQNVLVHNPSPEGFKIVSADPKPAQEDEMMLWSLGTLAPKQERRIKLEMVADRRGEARLQGDRHRHHSLVDAPQGHRAATRRQTGMSRKGVAGRRRPADDHRVQPRRRSDRFRRRPSETVGRSEGGKRAGSGHRGRSARRWREPRPQGSLPDGQRRIAESHNDRDHKRRPDERVRIDDLGQRSEDGNLNERARSCVIWTARPLTPSSFPTPATPPPTRCG